jgi:flagellar M-ring protein FliF
MNGVRSFWTRLQPGARVSFIAGVVLIAAAVAWLCFATLRPQYQVLFSRLADADAAVMVDQLKRLKIPYRLADDGTTIEVPADQVHETRLRLMSSGVPLSGAVGFEIFDKQGLGATEQSQRVSYQRALQGELARTIGALEDVKQARVHLVLPESTLFKRDRQEARAAVSLTLRPGATLSREQILGIQRLVAASVAALDPAKVVITDQRGVTLSGVDSLGATTDSSASASATEGRLQMKREVEDYVTRKIARLLDSTYGPGQAIVSVDVLLNFDDIHRTVQDLLPVHGGDHSVGIHRKRQVLSGAGTVSAATAAALPAVDPSDKDAATPPSNSTTEVEYEYGHSVEQVIAAPGGISRLNVGVVVPGDLSPEKQKRITDLVRVAAGISDERGDAIVVQPLDQLGTRTSLARESAAAEVAEPAAPALPQNAAAKVNGGGLEEGAWKSPSLWLVALLLAAGFLLLQRRRPAAAPRRVGAAPLSAQERQQLLGEIQRTLTEAVAPVEARAKS